MNNQTRQGVAEPRGIFYGRCSGVPCILLSGFIIFAHPDIFAQDSAPDTLSDTETAQISPSEQFPTEQAEASVEVVLPDAQQMARALSNTRTRQQALLDVAVAAHVLANIQGDVGAAVEAGVNHTSLVQTFLDDRAWLQMLVDRYGWEPPRITVLDPENLGVLEFNPWEIRQKLLQRVVGLPPTLVEIFKTDHLAQVKRSRPQASQPTQMRTTPQGPSNVMSQSPDVGSRRTMNPNRPGHFTSIQ